MPKLENIKFFPMLKKIINSFLCVFLQMVRTCWLYYFSKFIELLDTVSILSPHLVNVWCFNESDKLWAFSCLITLVISLPQADFYYLLFFIIILENRIFFPSLNSVRIPRLHLLLLEWCWFRSMISMDSPHRGSEYPDRILGLVDMRRWILKMV